ncbi:hypothetical protein [Streptomyces hesseae]|uniref:Uncharacterized protein n=1 Tax=Streptomyces hesseae TaxID=3075519 RepID=A0ABU2SRK9_9ACTN|nr:hypothetical protein [Streptomyces sp. DSM 40473]MDT0451632.1 hypothetical protein [Streptomyces sp. DSM 40473]
MTEPSPLGQPLLDYAVITEPFPLYAATEGAPPTTLHIVVSNGGAESVYCREIILSLPHGDLAQSLVVGDKDGEGSATGWTVEQLQTGAVAGLPEGDYEHFRATHQDEKAPVDRSGITITLKNLSISKEPGTARVEIRETATKDLGNWPTSVGYTTCTLTKFPAPEIPAQIVNDFRAEKPEAVAPDRGVHLTWRGPKTLNYTVSYGSGAKAADGQDDTVRDLEWKGTVTRDTTFYLTYEIGGVTHCLTTTVTVPDPQLTGLGVDGAATVGGTTTLGVLTVGGMLTAKSDLAVEYAGATKLTTSGVTGLQAVGLQVDGDATIDGDTTIKKDLTVGTAYASPHKFTTGGTGMGVEVVGQLHTKGDFVASGAVDLFSGSVYTKHSDYIGDGGEWNYTAPTDGFIGVHLVCLTHEGSTDARELTAQWAANVDVSSGASYSAGIPQGYLDGGTKATDSITAPVHKGESVKITTHGPQVIKGSGYITIYWHPMGEQRDLQ